MAGSLAGWLGSTLDVFQSSAGGKGRRQAGENEL
jgi:hypothetical protein